MGEICLFVFVSAPHRKVVFEAIEFIVEQIKKEAPVFGKEVFEDQTHVLQAGADFWKSVALWGLQNRQLTEKDKGILNVACAIPKRLPSEKQSTHLIALVERLKNKGAIFTRT